MIHRSVESLGKGLMDSECRLGKFLGLLEDMFLKQVVKVKRLRREFQTEKPS